MMFKKIYTNPFIIFPLAAIIVFWPLSFLLFSVKNDALTYYYPIRTLISDALHNGELPLWTPFINMGYPLHADMQSGAWNPIVWLFSFVSDYSLAGFHYELIFYVAFSGIGFYYLCKQSGCSMITAVSISLAYQFSGFIIDSVQFFPCISAACYLPWIILFAKKTLTCFRLKYAVALSIFMYLLFTGSYPFFIIITGYLLAALFLYYFFAANNKPVFTKKSLPVIFISVLLFIAISLPAIISFVQHLPFIERGKQQSLSIVLENSMNPFTMFSAISPFSVTADHVFTDSNVLMRNMYMGIIPLLFLLIAFSNGSFRKNRRMLLLLLCGILLLGMAWGKFFFLRQIAYYVLPFMNSFRHPALFRLYAIFFFLLIAASAMEKWRNEAQLQQSKTGKIIISAGLVFLFTGLICIFFINAFHPAVSFRPLHIKNILSALNFQQRYIIQLPFIISITIAACYIITKRKYTWLLPVIVFADLFCASQLNLPVTVIGAKKFGEVQQLVNRNSVRFPIPDTFSIATHSVNSHSENTITGSTLPFIKKIGRNDYYITPGNLSAQDKFYESASREAVFKNPVLYLSKVQATQSGDKLYMQSASSGNVYIQSISANSMKANVRSKEQAMLVYLQNAYPGWKVFIDGESRAIETVNTAFIGVQLAPGNHSILFEYKPQSIIWSWYLSVTIFMCSLLYLSFILFHQRKQRYAEGKLNWWN